MGEGIHLLSRLIVLRPSYFACMPMRVGVVVVGGKWRGWNDTISRKGRTSYRGKGNGCIVFWLIRNALCLLSVELRALLVSCSWLLRLANVQARTTDGAGTNIKANQKPATMWVPGTRGGGG